MSGGRQEGGRVHGPQQPSPQFLDLKSYRRKRLIDAAKLLPVLGAVGFLFPLPFFFFGRAEQHPDGATPLAVYFFSAWLLLIIAALALSHALKDPVSRD